MSFKAGVTGLWTLINFVLCLDIGDPPLSTTPLPDMIQLIAIGQSLWRLVGKVLLPKALPDSRDFHAPSQLAKDVPSGIHPILHDVPTTMRRKSGIQTWF